jgi:hypothetical protein
VLLPAALTEVLPEPDDRTGGDLIAQHVKHTLRRQAKVAANIHERDRLSVSSRELRQVHIEPAGVKHNVVLNFGQFSSFVIRAFVNAARDPSSRQTFKGLETVQTLRHSTRDAIDALALVDAEFQVDAGQLGPAAPRRRNGIVVVARTGRHVPLDVVSRLYRRLPIEIRLDVLRLCCPCGRCTDSNNDASTSGVRTASTIVFQALCLVLALFLR